MSVAPYDVGEKNIKRSTSALYRQLEFSYVQPRIESKTSSRLKSLSYAFDWRRLFNAKVHFGTQSEAFQAAMKFASFSGQCVGLLPFAGVLEKDLSGVRFEKRSARYVYSLTICAFQILALMFSLFRLLRDSISVIKLGYFSFYSTTCLTSYVFLRLASKWQGLMQKISSSNLNEYIDPYVRFKCNCATVFFILFSFVEHVLSIIADLSEVLDCHSGDQDIYRMYIEKSYPWLFDAGVPYSILFGIVLPIFNFASTIIWSYSHLFIICVSYFLSSILEQVNSRIKSCAGEYVPSSHWRKLREDYSRATMLVRAFDDAANSIVFTSFASNLFFVCLRLYHILSYGVKSTTNKVSSECTNYPSGPFNGNDYVVYLSFSLVFVLLRSLAVSMIAARVHSASLVPAPFLYSIPAPAYCSEVQRFIEQVHGDVVALTGLNFFYVTKELVLSVHWNRLMTIKKYTLSNGGRKKDEFLPTMTSILTWARWFGIPTYGNQWALGYSLVLLSMLTALEVGAIRKLYRAIVHADRSTNGGRGLVARLSGSVFYGNALISLLLSWRVARKWRKLSTYWLYIETKGLNVPPDSKIRTRIVCVSSFVAVCAFVEHVLSMISATGIDIPPEEYFERYILSSHGFLLHSYEYSLWIAVPVFILSKLATILWNFQDLIVILLSIGLTSRYHRLNIIVKDTIRYEEKSRFIEKSGIDIFYRMRMWRKIREAYVQQAGLVRRVDAELGSLILLCNVNNLYFICLQLFLGIRIANSSVISSIYYFASLGWLVFRACSVVLAAADINLHSKRALSALNSCPPAAYNVEIYRLKQQMIHDEVALSGKGFFYLDRQILLEVAAAIVKYELILIQYDND